MAQTLDRTAQRAQQQTAEANAPALDWRRKMSDHVAFALLIYTGLQIFMTMTVLKANHNTILPYLALVLLVAAIIPGCRMFEARWSDLPDDQASNPDLAGRFARDRMAIWLCAIGLPFVLTGMFKGLPALFG